MDAPASTHRSVAARPEPRLATPSRIGAIGVLRAVARGVGLLNVFAAAAVHYGVTVPFVRKPDRLRARARWLHRWSRHCARAIGLSIDQRGDAPASGMIVSNHLSYLDILVFSSITPCVFVAKREVARWPLLGFFTRMAGTIFVNRASRMQVAEVNKGIESALRAGVTVFLFAEGTSSDGSTVLPFRTALLEPMIKTQCRATAAAVAYTLTEGCVAEEVCYWRDMTLLPHLLNLLTKRGVEARVGFVSNEGRFNCRKQSAAALHEIVERLHQLLGHA